MRDAGGLAAPARERAAALRLRQRIARRFPLADTEVAFAGARHPYRLARPADPEALLDAMARARPSPLATERDATGGALRAAADEARAAVATGEYMPYWTLLWPSGLALAEALLAEPERVRGLRALELGCGLGSTATAALDAGAALWAADCFAEALLCCRYNGLRNVGRAPHTLLANWRSAVGRAACLALAPFDLLLAADALYEQDDLAPLLALPPRLVAPGGMFWLAEPGRRVSGLFVREALARGWHDAPLVFERAWPPDGQTARVTVHRFTLPGA